MIRPFRLLCVAALLLSSMACSDTPTDPSQVNVPYAQTDLVVGTGATATTGTRATVTYSGWLYNSSRTDNKGTQFDGPGSFSFVVGDGTLIRGFDQGVNGMRVGGTRRLTIPPNLAYGNSPPSASIPPNATLVFEVTLTAVS